jgi:hypothetical protein
VPIVNRTTHGAIERDEIWRGEIRVTGDIFVEEGVTLTIEPGTVVRVAANQDVANLYDWPFDMQQGIQNEADNLNGVHFGEPYRDEGHHITIRIMGTLHAVGTPEQMITITSDSPTPGIYDWNHFEFAYGTLSYSIVEYYRVLCVRDGTEVSDNILRHVGECGVCAGGSTVIEHNTISYAGHELIASENISPVVRNNHLGPNPKRVGIVVNGGSPHIVDNTIESCDVGIAFVSPPIDSIIEGNVFLNNRRDIQREY